jgi:pimeloyl-ACP methyl ester carboxylesterase
VDSTPSGDSSPQDVSVLLRCSVSVAHQLLNVFGRQVAIHVDGSGDPVVLLHGLGGTSETWLQTIDCLGGSLLTVAIDLAGHGHSARDRGDYSITANAVIVRGVLDQLGIDRALIVGHSYGGGVALAEAVIFPEKVAGLALVASGGLGNEAAPVLRAMSLPFVGELASLAIRPWLVGRIDATFDRLIALGFHEPTELRQTWLPADRFSIRCVVLSTFRDSWLMAQNGWTKSVTFLFWSYGETEIRCCRSPTRTWSPRAFRTHGSKSSRVPGTSPTRKTPAALQTY